MTTRITNLMTTTLKAGLAVGLISGMLLICGTASAQATTETTTERSAPLQGPRVKDNSVPGQPGRFGEGQRRPGERAQGANQTRQFMRALDAIRGPSVDDAVRLTDDQEAELKQIQDDFRGEVKGFMDTHGEEVRTLVQSLPPAERGKVMTRLRESGINAGGREGAEGGRPGRPRPSDEMAPADGASPATAVKPEKGAKPAKAPLKPKAPKGEKPADAPVDEMAPDQAPSADATKAMERLKVLEKEAPRAADSQKQMWTVLTDAQKPLVQAEMEKMRVEMEARRKAPREGGRPAKDGAKEPPAMEDVDVPNPK